jgi:hypothetical protein
MDGTRVVRHGHGRERDPDGIGVIEVACVNRPG